MDQIPAFVERHVRALTTYAIGIMAAYWFIERLVGLLRKRLRIGSET
jgi:hypothetical protein